MEPPKEILSSLWNFIIFLPFFFGLLVLGTVKGVVFCPLVCLIMTIGNSAIILGLWPLHIVKTYYSILRTKHIGPVLKIVLCICLPATLILWLVLGIVGSIIGGALYGLLSPIFATFDAVGERKTNMLYHCFYDGTWDTVKGSFTVVRDFGDVCYHSYFSLLDDLRQGAPDVKYYEIRLLPLPGAIIAASLGIVFDFPLVSLIAICKSPYMLFKGWHRLFHDLIGREGPFLETICVPFAGLAILLWPLAVVGAVLGSMVSSIFLGAYAGVVVYQESFWFGLCYIVASLAIYDEYSNDILDMPEGSCFPRPKYQKDPKLTKTTSRAASFSGSTSVRNPLSRGGSFNHPMVDLKPLELLDRIFKECQHHGEIFVSEGLITQQDIDDAKSGKGSRVISIGLPAYCILQALLRSVKANSVGILLSDNVTEITSTNRPKDTFYEWFLNPFLIIKDQIKAENLSEEEEGYLGRLVLLNGDPTKLKSLNSGPPPESERKRAELDALARRLQGITKSVSRYPTSRRNFDHLVKNLSENLAKKNGETKAINAIPRSKSAFARMFSQNSFKKKTSYHGSSDQETESISARNVEIHIV
ncbi:hypothetical protein POPTR_001G338900v4 [Populus trichocarpa]|uniref:Uncharacterized protein n=1 Tax=Populus trichocarpa TaxID=3694 RepID=A0A2K2C7V0_POPTR|nr:uncharacterized membrane protein At3g27390 isoform X2 [Populus trichocarpa]KAI5604630.1 hypothetical protein BDE02_01G301700 [Populus trichocarpa]PNT58108.1 hypothetical protein POPTR_001G338900v4 [Populus trichocarpa]|eukprot:XP_002298580.1 uncharacterized membrane protein At3g27390 isoform X2 [Populus trichocarpa]